MPSNAPADGADKGTSKYDDITGGSGGTGKDPFVGSFPSKLLECGDCRACTGGDGDKTGEGV